MDEKKKWWMERSNLFRTKAGKVPTSIVDGGPLDRGQASGRFGGADETERPGAVAVHGPGYRSDDDGGRDDEDVSAVRVGGEGRNGNNEEATDAPAALLVDSYVVNVGPTDDEIRQHILANTSHAQAVTSSEQTTRKNGSAALILVIGVVAVVAVAIGIAVPLATRSQQNIPTVGATDGDVVASMHYLEWQGSGGFASALQAQTREDSATGKLVSSGAVELIGCKVNACMEDDGNCAVGEFYTPGCCAGADCPNETQCGDLCPQPPDSCFLKDPTNKTCIRSECYICNQDDNGTDIYKLRDFVYEVDCLEAGTAIRPENGQMYKWAIICGPVILGPVVEENRDMGEYQCTAVRLGANFSDDDGGLLTSTFPCQFLALAECGCGPSDMYTFGLPDPTGPCLPEGGCPLLCEDAGPAYVRNLCRSFPGNISWWEGQNVFSSTLFHENSMAPTYEFEIYIKGIDDEN